MRRSPWLRPTPRRQGLYREATASAAAATVYSERLALDLGRITASIAGPKRPQDRISLSNARPTIQAACASMRQNGPGRVQPVTLDGQHFELTDLAVVIAAITSCTNTSNPGVIIAAGLLARNAVAKGLTVKTLGQDLAGAGLAGRHRLPGQCRTA